MKTNQNQNIGYLWRIIATIALLLVWGAVNFVWTAAGPLKTSEVAVHQLDNSDTSYLVSQAAIKLGANGTKLPGWPIYGLLLLVWINPLVRLFKGSTAATAAILMLSLVGAHASYNPKDEVEWKTIGSNQTVFVIPMQGANKDSQGSLDSAAYLDSKKVSTKRIQITHTLLPKVGMFTQDVFIPNMQVMICNRSSYARQWTKDADRGTSKANEGFFFQSKEGIDVDVGLSISAKVEEKGTATYLYYWGTSEEVDGIDKEHPEFASTRYARSLNDVMDSVVHEDCQCRLFNEFGVLTLQECNAQAATVVKKIAADLKKDYAEYGITINYVGIASPLNYSQKIQDAIDNRFIAEQDAAAAANRMTSMPVLQGLAEIKVKEGLATALSKFEIKDLHLPSFVVIPENMAGAVGSLFKTTDVPKEIPKLPAKQ